MGYTGWSKCIYSGLYTLYGVNYTVTNNTLYHYDNRKKAQVTALTVNTLRIRKHSLNLMSSNLFNGVHCTVCIATKTPGKTFNGLGKHNC